MAPGARELGTALCFSLFLQLESLSFTSKRARPINPQISASEAARKPLGDHSAPPLHWAGRPAQVCVQIACPPIDARLII